MEPPMPESPIIRIEDLHKAYQGTQVLKGISLEVQEKEVVVIVGPLGSEPGTAGGWGAAGGRKGRHTA